MRISRRLMSTAGKEPSTANLLFSIGAVLGLLIVSRLYLIFEDQLKMRHRLENELKQVQIHKVELEIAQLKLKKD